MKNFELPIPCLTTYILEVIALVSLKVAAICHFRDKKRSKISSKNAATETCDQNDLCFSPTFEIFIPCLTIYLGEVTTRASLNVATDGSLTGKKNLKNEHFETIILKPKKMSANKVT